MTEQTGARIIRQANQVANLVLAGDEFINEADLAPVRQAAARRSLKQALTEIEEMTRQCLWQDIIALFHPVEEKLPEVEACGLEVAIREKIAFAMGQLNYFDDAIKELKKAVRKEPENFYVVNSLAYTAYNSLYAAKNKEAFLRGAHKRDRIALAHEYFNRANELRPDGVTNFYRQGMLYKQLEDKPRQAMECFQTAIHNWETLDAAAREKRHQEKKNYVKSLFQLAALILNDEKAAEALALLEKCREEDKTTDYLAPLFKMFALGKIYFHMNRFESARDALEAAIAMRKANQPYDFVAELLARTYIGLNQPERARARIDRIPPHQRRAYFRWTEADVLCALKEFDQAKIVLSKAAERDTRSRHKALIRLVKIEYLQGDFKKAEEHAQEADAFFREKWGNICQEALFWRSLCAYQSGDFARAETYARELNDHAPYYPRLPLLVKKIREAVERQSIVPVST